MLTGPAAPTRAVSSAPGQQAGIGRGRLILLAVLVVGLGSIWWNVLRSSTVTVVNRTTVPIAFAAVVIEPCSTRTFDGSPYYVQMEEPIPSGAYIFKTSLMYRAWPGSGRADMTLVITPTYIGVPARNFTMAGERVAPATPESVPCSGPPPEPSPATQ